MSDPISNLDMERRLKEDIMPAKNTENADTIDLRTILKALRGFRKGDFSVRLPDDLTGMAGDVATAFNDVCVL